MFMLKLSDYDITRDGKVINKRNGHILKPDKNGKGYFRVSIGKKRYFIHRLVAEKYLPNPFNKPQVNHIDGDKTNNCVENLEWVINQENRNHAKIHGLQVHGECSYAKLTEKDVIYIRENQDKFLRKDLASMFGVDPSTITDIVKRKSWKYL